jgi:hypothetical protein
VVSLAREQEDNILFYQLVVKALPNQRCSELGQTQAAEVDGLGSRMTAERGSRYVQLVIKVSTRDFRRV